MIYRNFKFNKLFLIGLMLFITFPLFAETIKAKLNWSGRVALSPLVKGYISEVNVYPGDKVKKGDILMRLSPDVFQAKIDHFIALLKSNKSILDEAKRELNRSKELYERTLLSDHDLQTDKNAYVLASANHTSTLTQLKSARIELEYSINRAPFNALVIQRDAEMGQSVFPDFQPKPFIVIAEDNVMLANAWLTAEQAKDISSLSKTVKVRINGTSHEGKILFVGQEPKSNTELLYKLVIKFNLNGQHYRAGLPAEVIVDDL
jgi:RND family efflux transporter MFP subunit